MTTKYISTDMIPFETFSQLLQTSNMKKDFSFQDLKEACPDTADNILSNLRLHMLSDVCSVREIATRIYLATTCHSLSAGLAVIVCYQNTIIEMVKFEMMCQGEYEDILVVMEDIYKQIQKVSPCMANLAAETEILFNEPYPSKDLREPMMRDFIVRKDYIREKIRYCHYINPKLMVSLAKFAAKPPVN